MFSVTLPSGEKKTFKEPCTVADVAASIAPGLARSAVAGCVDGILTDTSFTIGADCALRIITLKDSEGLEVLRHSCAHLMAQAVQNLFPEAQVTIGPVIENGFYYDFAYKRAFTPEDLEAIEKEMKSLAKQKLSIERQSKSKSELIDIFTKKGEKYKVEIINSLDEEKEITLYNQGNFSDLCKGPHLPHTGFIKAFKLTKLAGAYWRGDSANEMLQRVYGTAWADKKDLSAYLDRLEQAKARDHRTLVKKMNLCHFQDIAPGLVFWHNNGWSLFRVLKAHIRQKMAASGYDEVHTPMLVDMKLWEDSGHKAKFNDSMFQISLSEKGESGQTYAIKPMSCPCHVQIFKQGTKSYRDLPVRLGEFGSCHRNEPSGSLHGLMRVRGFVQDDGHIFCTPEQISKEASLFIDQVYDLYKDFSFDKSVVQVKLSTRPEQRVGSDALWDLAEDTLSSVLNEKQLNWELLPGEGAFYGPKIEFSLEDCLGRVWQCGTLQLDFFMPERLDATYIDHNGEKKHPVMLHRAVLGSIERFIGILLEHSAGHLPLWLSPVQVVVMGISDKHAAYAQEITEKLKKYGLKVKYDLRNEKIGFKIREHTIARVPYFILVGDQEESDGTVSVRKGSGEKLQSQSVDDFAKLLLNEIESKHGGKSH